MITVIIEKPEAGDDMQDTIVVSVKKNESIVYWVKLPDAFLNNLELLYGCIKKVALRFRTDETGLTIDNTPISLT